MAAPLKQGLDYFPLDVNLEHDDKLGMIIGEYGEKGERLYIKMLSWTYGHEGYYFDYKEDVQLRFLRRYNYCGFDMSFIKEVVPKFIRWGLFDKTVFDAFQILTSPRIQKTWLEASRKRKNRSIYKNFWLLNVSDASKAELTLLTAEVIDKVKEIKPKEIKEKKTKAPKAPDDDLDFEKIIEEKFGAGFYPTWDKWKTYKRVEHKFNYKSQESESAAITELHNLSKGNQITAGAIIHQSMSNGWKGFFDLKEQNVQNAGAGNSVKSGNNQPPQSFANDVSRYKVEIDYLYSRYLEGQCTTISVEAAHYHYLKKANLITFTEEQTADIRSKALELIKQNKREPEESLVVLYMKKFGVLEFFEKLKNEGKPEVQYPAA